MQEVKQVHDLLAAAWRQSNRATEVVQFALTLTNLA